MASDTVRGWQLQVRDDREGDLRENASQKVIYGR